jgi:hypothetical protein
MLATLSLVSYSAAHMQGERWQPDEIRRLVRALGEAGGSLRPTLQQMQQLRDFFGRRVLRDHADAYILGKYQQHVEDDEQWPIDTTPEEYLSSLRQTVLDPRSDIYLTDADSAGEWSIYFVGRVRRAWRGPKGSNRMLVVFSAEYHRFVTGFQPDDDDEYIEQQGGFWLGQL